MLRVPLCLGAPRVCDARSATGFLPPTPNPNHHVAHVGKAANPRSTGRVDLMHIHTTQPHRRVLPGLLAWRARFGGGGGESLLGGLRLVG